MNSGLRRRSKVLYAFMVSLASRESEARSSIRLSSTSPWTYFARTILNTLRRDRIRTAREALHGAKRPSSKTPESKKTLGTAEGLPLAIEALETASAYSRQVFQRLARRDSSACQCVLDTLAKMIEGHVGGYNHQCLTELDEQDFTPLRELVQFPELGRDYNPTLITHPDTFR